MAFVAAYQELLLWEASEVPGGERPGRHGTLAMSRGHRNNYPVNLPVRHRQHCLGQDPQMGHQLPLPLSRQHR